MMDIKEALKRDDISVRISCDGKWLVWSSGEWYVLTRPYKAKSNLCLYRGGDFSQALKTLVGDRE